MCSRTERARGRPTEACARAFPTSELREADVITTWAGVRPVIDTGKKDPSKESREHAIWKEDGLLTITGGKLTTFAVMARDALVALGGTYARLYAIQAEGYR